MLGRGGAPLRQCTTVMGADGPWGKTNDDILAHIGRGSIIALLGERGGGKTGLAVSAMRAVCEAEMVKQPSSQRSDAPAVYTTAMGLFLGLRATFKSEGQSEADTIARFTRPALLVIDEVQERGNTEWEDRILVHIIDQRYAAMRDTILIGNLHPRAFQAAMGSSITSRIQETGFVIECSWGSYRAKQTPTTDSHRSMSDSRSESTRMVGTAAKETR